MQSADPIQEDRLSRLVLPRLPAALRVAVAAGIALLAGIQLAGQITNTSTGSSDVPAQATRPTVNTGKAGAPEAVDPFETLVLDVQRGDTLDSLFRESGLSVVDLAEILQLDMARQNLRVLQPGDTISVRHDGSTVLVEVYRYLLDTHLFEFPIGGMQPGEDPLEVAKRELAEEAGLVARDWQLLGRFAPYKGVSNEIDWFFLARDLTWTHTEHEPSEQITVHPMPLAQARQVLFEQTLLDGQSIAGLALLDRFLAAQGR